MLFRSGRAGRQLITEPTATFLAPGPQAPAWEPARPAIGRIIRNVGRSGTPSPRRSDCQSDLQRQTQRHEELAGMCRAGVYRRSGCVLDKPVDATQEGIRRFGIRIAPAGRVRRDQLPAAMLTHNPPTQVLHADVQPPATCRTLLDEERRSRHERTSCYRTAVHFTPRHPTTIGSV